MERLTCGHVWGGFSDLDSDVCSAGLTASLFCDQADGGKGGDIYYMSVCDGDMLTRMVVADVVGHGPTVTEYSKLVYEAVAANMNDGEGGQLLSRVNRFAAEQGLNVMTTAAAVAFYTQDGRLYFSYAGHPPALIKRKDETVWKPAALSATSDGPANLPLAVVPDTHFDQESVELSSGDRVFVYTDGVVEAPRAGNLFGATRLRDVLNEAHDEPLHNVKRAVVNAILAHTGGSLAHDDVTMLAVEVR